MSKQNLNQKPSGNQIQSDMKEQAKSAPLELVKDQAQVKPKRTRTKSNKPKQTLKFCRSACIAAAQDLFRFFENLKEAGKTVNSIEYKPASEINYADPNRDQQDNTQEMWQVTLSFGANLDKPIKFNRVEDPRKMLSVLNMSLESLSWLQELDIPIIYSQFGRTFAKFEKIAKI